MVVVLGVVVAASSLVTRVVHRQLRAVGEHPGASIVVSTGVFVAVAAALLLLAYLIGAVLQHVV